MTSQLPVGAVFTQVKKLTFIKIVLRISERKIQNRSDVLGLDQLRLDCPTP